MHFMNTLLARYQSLQGAVKSILIFSATVVFTGIIFLFNLIFIDLVANHVMAPVEQSDRVLDSSIAAFPRPSYVPETYYHTLKSQSQMMRERKEHHWKLAKLFFRNYYSILFLTILLASVG